MNLKAIGIVCAIGAILCQNKFATLILLLLFVVCFIAWLFNQVADKGY